MEINRRRKIFNRVSIAVYALAAYGLASIIVEPASEQPVRFQYRNISPGGFARTLADVLELAALVVLMLNTFKKPLLNKTLVSLSLIVYSILILIDINSWLFATAYDGIYYLVIFIQALPLVLFTYQQHVFQKEYRGVLIAGIIMLSAGIIWQHYFYRQAVDNNYRPGFYYDYPVTIKLMGWLCFTGMFLIITSVAEWISSKIHIDHNIELLNE